MPRYQKHTSPALPSSEVLHRLITPQRWARFPLAAGPCFVGAEHCFVAPAQIRLSASLSKERRRACGRGHFALLASTRARLGRGQS